MSRINFTTLIQEMSEVKMEKVIIVTPADMNTSAGNVTLLIRRADSMYRLYDYYTDIIVYRGNSKNGKNSNNGFYSISYMDSKKQLYEYIIEQRPVYIIIYGSHLGLLPYGIHRILNSNNIQCKVLFDVQSCIEEKWEFGKGIKGKLTYPASLLLFRLAISNVDGAFVVSDELEENCKQKLLWPHKLEFYKIRCGVTSVLSYNEVQNYRKLMRQNLGINDDCIAFVYSGYRMAWQKVDEIINEFREFDKRLPNAFFLFFCNTDTSFEQQLRDAFPRGNYIVKLLSKDEYQKSLCGCDIGYILRDYKETNRVAFPNKFSDYLSAGLLIAMNKSLPEPLRVLTNNNLPYIDTELSIDDRIQHIKNFYENREAYIQAALKVCYKELLYDNQFKAIQFQ